MAEYIERDMVLREAESRIMWGASAMAVYELIRDVPAADVAPVLPGKWEWFEEWSPGTTDYPTECDDCGWRCSNCKTKLEDVVGGYWDDPDDEPKMKFCPNCGADMRGSNDE